MVLQRIRQNLAESLANNWATYKRTWRTTLFRKSFRNFWDTAEPNRIKWMAEKNRNVCKGFAAQKLCAIWTDGPDCYFFKGTVSNSVSQLPTLSRELENGYFSAVRPCMRTQLTHSRVAWLLIYTNALRRHGLLCGLIFLRLSTITYSSTSLQGI